MRLRINRQHWLAIACCCGTTFVGCQGRSPQASEKTERASVSVQDNGVTQQRLASFLGTWKSKGLVSGFTPFGSGGTVGASAPRNFDITVKGNGSNSISFDCPLEGGYSFNLRFDPKTKLYILTGSGLFTGEVVLTDSKGEFTGKTATTKVSIKPNDRGSVWMWTIDVDRAGDGSTGLLLGFLEQK